MCLQKNGTEPPFSNEYWDNKEPGIYVDVVSGGLRYCINSAALRFIPADDLEREGYGAYHNPDIQATRAKPGRRMQAGTVVVPEPCNAPPPA